MRPVATAVSAFKAAGFALFAVAYLLSLLLTGVGFYMEEASAVLLVPYVVLSLWLLVGLARPRAFSRLARGETTRRRVAALFGIPAGLLLAALYFLTTFHVRDLDEVVFLLFAASAACLFLGLARPSAFASISGGLAARSRVAAIFGAAALALFLLFLFSIPLLETHRLARLERADADRERAASAGPGQASGGDRRVRVYPLHVGDTRVTYGQFYGGLDGWEGLAGYARTLVDKDVIEVPLYAYLIDHPDHGLMLVDTGAS